MTPLTVTVWAIFQFNEVNVRLEADTVPSAVLLLLIGIVTFASGLLVSATVKLEVPPASVVVNPEVGPTAMPAVSSSVLLTLTPAAFRPL